MSSQPTTGNTTPPTQQAPIFTGVGVALVTLFDSRDRVDAKATADLAASLADTGLRAILVAGSTGEAAALEPEERVELITAVATAIPADVMLLAGTGAPSARQAISLTREAREAGAQAALVLSPPRVPDPRGYYEAVATAAPDLPLLAYHFPTVSSPGIPVSMLDGLPVVGLKDSSGDAGRLLETLDTYSGGVYVGSSALLSMAGPLGATGAILALANALPETCIEAFSGDVAAQRALAAPHRGMTPFPSRIKSMTADRWGTSRRSRLG